MQEIDFTGVALSSSYVKRHMSGDIRFNGYTIKGVIPGDKRCKTLRVGSNFDEPSHPRRRLPALFGSSDSPSCIKDRAQCLADYLLWSLQVQFLGKTNR